MSEEQSNAYLNPKQAGSCRVVHIDIEKEPVYSEIPSEPECFPPQQPKSRRSKSESEFSHELEPFIHMRRKDQPIESRAKRRSAPGNQSDSKDKVYVKSLGRKSWHQETEGRQLRIFEEINCSAGRQSTIFYEVENENGLSRSRISLVEKKVLAVQVSRISLENTKEESLPVPQRKGKSGSFKSRLGRMTKTQIFVIVAMIILMIGGIAAVFFYLLRESHKPDAQEADKATTRLLGTRWTNITDHVKQEDEKEFITALP